MESMYPLNPSLDEELSRLFENNCTMPFNGFRSQADVEKEFRTNGVDSEYLPPWSIQPVKINRKKREQLQKECVFCKNNGAPYKDHCLKDDIGRILCPVLRVYKCPYCGECGDKAHTKKYCPKKLIKSN